MHRLKIAGALTATALLVGCAVAGGDLKSGPPEGSKKILPFNPEHANGPDAGTGSGCGRRTGGRRCWAVASNLAACRRRRRCPTQRARTERWWLRRRARARIAGRLLDRGRRPDRRTAAAPPHRRSTVKPAND